VAHVRYGDTARLNFPARAAAWTGAIAAGAADEADTSAAREEEAERGIAGDTAAAAAADEAVRRQRTRSRRLGAGRGSQRPVL